MASYRGISIAASTVNGPERRATNEEEESNGRPGDNDARTVDDDRALRFVMYEVERFGLENASLRDAIGVLRADVEALKTSLKSGFDAVGMCPSDETSANFRDYEKTGKKKGATAILGLFFLVLLALTGRLSSTPTAEGKSGWSDAPSTWIKTAGGDSSSTADRGARRIAEKASSPRDQKKKGRTADPAELDAATDSLHMHDEIPTAKLSMPKNWLSERIDVKTYPAFEELGKTRTDLVTLNKGGETPLKLSKTNSGRGMFQELSSSHWKFKSPKAAANVATKKGASVTQTKKKSEKRQKETNQEASNEEAENRSERNVSGCSELKGACGRSLEKDSMEFCEDAEVACCEDDNNPQCGCNLYQQICSESPGRSTCDFAMGKCCDAEGDSRGGHRCVCDFYTSAANILEDQRGYGAGNCSEANEEYRNASPRTENAALVSFYNNFGGEHWIGNDGWLNGSIPHCQWFGLECNREGFVAEINLRSNNVAGEDPLSILASFTRLTRMDIAENELRGQGTSQFFSALRHLDHIDISGNHFTGHSDMSLAPSVTHANFSHNDFTTAGFKRFNLAYETLLAVDLSHNRINQTTSAFFLNVPPNLQALDLSHNALRGALPDPFPLARAEVFVIANNAVDGGLPNFSRSRRLRQLNLSNQHGDGGLSGRIPISLYKQLVEVSDLDLSGNKFSGEIPSSLGRMQGLRVLNLSSNAMDGTIPKQLDKLRGDLRILDLSNNKLRGSIPLELADLPDFHLGGNSNLSDPAPLDLCRSAGFDASNDTRLCPPERNALVEFYDSANGLDWTESGWWLDQVVSHCDWHGISCVGEGTNRSIQKLELQNNGLSGKLDEKIGELSSLEVLDLSDNDIRGSIPSELRHLSKLTRLLLRYNDFIGNETNFGGLRHLELVQLQGNRLSGTIPKLNLPFSDSSSFVSDCGNPSDFTSSLVCEDCTMCCNAQGDCHPTKENIIRKAGFKNYMYFTAYFLGSLVLLCGALALAVNTHDRYRNRNLPRSTVQRTHSSCNRDQRYALETVGRGSVYQFFLGKSCSGWVVVILTMAVQIWLLFIFVGGAEIDWTNDRSDLVYTWKCPRDEEECNDRSDLDWEGWLAFVILMIVHLLKDVINGAKVIVLSGKQRHSRNTRARYFVGGMLLTIVSVFTFYVSTIYNAAIATNNREIIENSVIILLICDVDEYVYKLLMVIGHHAVNSVSLERPKREDREESFFRMGRQVHIDEGGDSEQDLNQNLLRSDESGAETLESQMQDLKMVVETLEITVERQNAQLQTLLGPQNERGSSRVAFRATVLSIPG